MRDSQAFFGGKAESYRTSATHGAQADLARMLAWTRPARGARALDVATGGGHTALALAQASVSTVATDVTREMLHAVARSARERGLEVARAACEAARLPFRAGSFDLVTSRIAPHHFRDLDAFARESARVLRPGGALYVYDLTTPEDSLLAARIDAIERARDASHVASRPPSAWRRALAGAGFAVERIETSASVIPVGPWIARAELPAERERELWRLLRETPPEKLGGFGLVDADSLRLLRVEILARR